MRDKQLSKAAWEAAAKKHDVDPKELSKALAAYEKCADDDYEGQEKTLQAVAKTAGSLEKDKTYKAAADYLGDVHDAAEKAIEATTAAKDQEDDDAEDEELAEYKKDLGTQLKNALAKVKSLAPGDPPPGPGESKGQMKFMAYVAPAGSGVVVAKKVGGGTRRLLAAVAGATGGKYYQGECIFEKNAHTFVLAELPGGLRKKLADALLEATKTAYHVRVRSADGAEEPEGTPPPALNVENLVARLKTLKPDLDKVLAGNVPSSGAAKTQFITTAGLVKAEKLAEATAGLASLEIAIKNGLAELAAVTGAADPQAEFKARLIALTPKIKEALVAQSPASVEIRAKVAQAGALAKQGKSAEGLALLKDVESLLGGGGASKPPQTEKKSPQQEYEAMLEASRDDYVDACKAQNAGPEAVKLIERLRVMWDFAEGKAQNGAYDSAMKAMLKIGEEGLFARIRELQAAASGKPVSNKLVEQRKFLLTRWQQIPAELSGHVSELQADLAAQLPEEDTASAIAKLNGYLKTLLATLQGQIDKVIGGGASDISLDTVRKEIDGDEVLSCLGKYPLGDGHAFRETILQAVEEVETHMAA
jgi:hypothetical protein